MKEHKSIKKAGRFFGFIFVCALWTCLLCSNSFAFPVTYSLYGTAYAVDPSGSSPLLYGDISGTMIMESDPSGLTFQPDGYGSLNWIISELTITSSIFEFNGAGSFRLTGYPSGLNDWNEGGMSGYGATPYNSGQMYFMEDILPNCFYYEDGTPYQDSFTAYSAGLPYIIAPMTDQTVPFDLANPNVTGAWRFSFDGSDPSLNTAAVVSLYAVRTSAPVPEPSTLFLLGSGLFGLVGIRKKIKNESV